MPSGSFQGGNIMSEAEANHFCEKCEKETIHIFSGSLRKGVCMTCGNHLHPEEKPKLSEVLSYIG